MRHDSGGYISRPLERAGINITALVRVKIIYSFYM